LVKVRAHVVISGGVQGVFFRQTTAYEAEKRGVTGWVRNLADGRVEAIFEGEELNVKELVEYCRMGPRGARVTSLNVTWEPYSGGFETFEVRAGVRF
jgi:acylphosphatase